MALIVNLYGGPGLGKSTTAAGIFFFLKSKGINCELVTEFAKDLTWEGRTTALSNQIYVFGKQHHKLFRVKDKVDVVITDSPLLLSMIYNNYKTYTFNKLVYETYNQFTNVDYFLGRVKKYNPAGRNQTEDEAKQLDNKIHSALKDLNIDFNSIVADSFCASKIANDVIKLL